MHMLKAAQLAEKLNLNPETIRRLTRAGKIPHIQVGKSKRYDLDAVMKAMKPNTEEPSQ